MRAAAGLDRGDCSAQRLRGPAPNNLTSDLDGLQDRRLKPLGHPSALMRKRTRARSLVLMVYLARPATGI